MSEPLPFDNLPVVIHLHMAYEQGQGWRLSVWGRASWELPTGSPPTEYDRLAAVEAIDVAYEEISRRLRIT